MTHSGGKPHTNVGDRGQRYEIRMTGYGPNAPGESVLGWADTPGAAQDMMDAILTAPGCTGARVIDRLADLATFCLVAFSKAMEARDAGAVSGTMECPKCRAPLEWWAAQPNGHIRATCSTPNSVTKRSAPDCGTISHSPSAL